MNLIDNAVIDNGSAGPFDWLCTTLGADHGICDAAKVDSHLNNADNWTHYVDCYDTINAIVINGVAMARVLYCLSQKTEDQCKLLFSPAISDYFDLVQRY